LEGGVYHAEYPIISIEDPFEQDDWDHTKKLTELNICQVESGPSLHLLDIHLPESDCCNIRGPAIFHRYTNCLRVSHNSRGPAIFHRYTYCLRVSHKQVVGDDLLVTNPKRVAKAIEEKTCNALLLKVHLVK
jgi:hypothetical protein